MVDVFERSTGMRVGTKSLLFGVHQFAWHPFTVALAWVHCYRQLPKWWELVAIFCHDVGYWGKPNMDGPEGQTHPEAGANLAFDLVFRLAFTFTPRSQQDSEYLAHDARFLCLGHSCHFANLTGAPLSKLWLADKASVLFEPPWFYLARAYVTGELWEYVYNSPNETAFGWFQWYAEQVNQKVKKQYE